MKKNYFIPQITVKNLGEKEVLTASVEVAYADDWREDDLFFEFILE